MSFTEENWQTTRPTIRERSKFIFNNERFSDVKFVVAKMGGESEGKRRKQVIPAHKFVLSISSPVFEAMFYGELAETGDSIQLPDCEYESLLELFRYLYSDEVNLSGSNVMGVLYLAKKYMVPSLAEKCIEYLQDNVDPSDVFIVLPSAQKYEAKKLVDTCWEVIDKQTEEAVKSDGFATIERSLLEAVVVRDSLTIEEIELFKAVDLWATKECERQGLAADGAIKRRILGETIVKALRFPTIEEKDFAGVVLDSKILTQDEIISIIKHLNSIANSPVGFPETGRPGFKGTLQRCCTFRLLPDNTFRRFSHERMYLLNFSIDKNITIHGVSFFGVGTYRYKVDLTIDDPRGKLGSNSGEFTPETFQCKEGTYDGFEVLLKRGIVLVKNTTYCIKAKIVGPAVWYNCGHSDGKSVICSGVIFTFKDTQKQRDENGGQFPELLFSL